MSEQDQKTKEALAQGLGSFARQLIDFINKLGMDQQLKSFCFMNLDQATFWANQGIAALQFDKPKVPDIKDILPPEAEVIGIVDAPSAPTIN